MHRQHTSTVFRSRNVYVLRCKANSKSNRYSHAEKTSENSGGKKTEQSEKKKKEKKKKKKKNIMRTDNDGDPTLVS